MSYSIEHFNEDFPNDDACLDYIFRHKYPSLTDSYYRIKGRKSYVNSTGHQIHPLSGTIFEKSRTPLRKWFFTIYLFSQSKNGVSAAELQRLLGVTYKTAWRMGHRVRSLLQDEALKGDRLAGVVEVDETYFGGRHHRSHGRKKKTTVIGMVERGGRVRTQVIPYRYTHIVLNAVRETVAPGSTVMSDEFSPYKKLPHFGYESRRVKHGKRHWVHGDIHTNTIEGFWGLLKPALKGTHRVVSKKYFQNYADEFAFRYSYRDQELFPLMLGRI